jgi:6-phosphogluconolactonase (cycloisomerase 2 family)
MALRRVLIVLIHLAYVRAFKLLVASYGPEFGAKGAVQTLEFDKNLESSNGSLPVIHNSTDCGILPSWLDISSSDGIVTCVDENTPGSLNVLTAEADGSLKRVSTVPTLGGPVSSVRYNSAIALAHVSRDCSKPASRYLLTSSLVL